MDWHTPLGKTKVVNKRENPTWMPPESVRKEHIANGEPPLPAVVPAGPDNPLGEYAMRLGLTGAYLIHGTNNPIAVGMAVTHGCIRMYPEDIEELFPMVAVGTPVYLVNEPVKVAWVDGQLLLEAHPPVDAQGQTREPGLTVLRRAAGAGPGRLRGGHPLGPCPRRAGARPGACRRWWGWPPKPRSARKPRPDRRP